MKIPNISTIPLAMDFLPSFFSSRPRKKNCIHGTYVDLGIWQDSKAEKDTTQFSQLHENDRIWIETSLFYGARSTITSTEYHEV